MMPAKYPTCYTALLSAALLGVFALLQQSPAHAIGVCEGGVITYQLTHINRRAGLLAFEVKEPSCTPVEVGGSLDERWTTQTSILIMNLTLQEKGRYKAAGFRPERKGFQPIEDVALGGAGLADCKIAQVALLSRKRVSSLEDAPRKNHDFSTHQVGLRITAGGAVLPPLGLGEHTVEAGAFSVWLLPMGRAVRSFAVLSPSCGGPPPGSFGADDGGQCYPHWVPVYRDHPGLKLPDGCLPAPH